MSPDSSPVKREPIQTYQYAKGLVPSTLRFAGRSEYVDDASESRLQIFILHGMLHRPPNWPTAGKFTDAMLECSCGLPFVSSPESPLILRGVLTNAIKRPGSAANLVPV